MSKLSAISIQLSAFSDQLTVALDVRDHGSGRALCGDEMDKLLNGSIGPVIDGFDPRRAPGQRRGGDGILTALLQKVI